MSIAPSLYAVTWRQACDAGDGPGRGESPSVEIVRLGHGPIGLTRPRVAPNAATGGPPDVFSPSSGRAPVAASGPQLAQAAHATARQGARGGLFGLVASWFEPTVSPADSLSRQEARLTELLASGAPFGARRDQATKLLKEGQQALQRSLDYRARKESDLAWHHEMRAGYRAEQCGEVLAEMEKLAASWQPEPSASFDPAALSQPSSQGVSLGLAHVVLPGAILRVRNPRGDASPEVT